MASYGFPAPAPRGFSARRWLAGQLAEIKAVATEGMRFPTFGIGSSTYGSGWSYGPNSNWWWQGSTQPQMPDYSALIGDGSKTAVVEPVIRWIARNFPAPIRVRQRIDANETEEFFDHPLVDLIEAPNDYYDAVTLLKATAVDLAIDGNAYWLKVPSSAGRPAELWWIPHMLIEPRWSADDPTAYIDNYRYMPGGGAIYEYPPEQIIHFRDGLDPQNTRKGMSGLKSVLREVYTDEEAARFSAAILLNMGVPGTIIAPSGDKPIGADDAEKAKHAFDTRTRGQNRGQTIVFGQPTTIEQFGFSPQQLDLRTLRRLPEERVSAALGVPAIVAGLGAGLDRSTFANYAEAREAGYEECVIPLQKLIASTLRRRLLVDYVDDLAQWEVYFDLKDIRILQPDETALSSRVGQQVRDGIVTRAEGRRTLGYDATPQDDVYLLPIHVIEVPATNVVPTLTEPTDTSGDAAEQQSAAALG